MMGRNNAVKRGIVTIAAIATPLLAVGPASAWYAGGGGYHYSGSYSSSGGQHTATTARGGTASASNGSWSSTSATGRSNSGTYGTTANGTHYATGSYGGAVATNNGHWGAESNGSYAYGTHYYGSTTYSGAYHPPTVTNQYYATGCYNCGGWSAAGAAAAGAAAGVVVGAAIGASAASSAAPPPVSPYAIGTVYAVLPAGCSYAPVGGQTYLCLQRRLVPPLLRRERALLCGRPRAVVRDLLQMLLRRSSGGAFCASGAHGPSRPLRSGSRKPRRTGAFGASDSPQRIFERSLSTAA